MKHDPSRWTSWCVYAGRSGRCWRASPTERRHAGSCNTWACRTSRRPRLRHVHRRVWTEDRSSKRVFLRARATTPLSRPGLDGLVNLREGRSGMVGPENPLWFTYPRLRADHTLAPGNVNRDQAVRSIVLLSDDRAVRILPPVGGGESRTDRTRRATEGERMGVQEKGRILISTVFVSFSCAIRGVFCAQ